MKGYVQILRNISEETENMTPTQMAAQYFEKGYTPEQVQDVMRNKKILYPTISEVLNEFMGRENISVEKLSILSDVKVSTIYRIMNRQRNPNRNTILRLALALALSFEETQVLLKSGNCSLLSAARERDLVIMSGIANELDYESVNKELTEKGMPDLNVRF